MDWEIGMDFNQNKEVGLKLTMKFWIQFDWKNVSSWTRTIVSRGKEGKSC